MTSPIAPATAGTSTRPYLIRALHDWCTDNGFTPYLAVHVDRSVTVPMEYVKNNEIVLNVGFEATSSLKLGNDFIEFRARFGGMAWSRRTNWAEEAQAWGLEPGALVDLAYRLRKNRHPDFGGWELEIIALRPALQSM